MTQAKVKIEIELDVSCNDEFKEENNETINALVLDIQKHLDNAQGYLNMWVPRFNINNISINHKVIM